MGSANFICVTRIVADGRNLSQSQILQQGLATGLGLYQNSVSSSRSGELAVFAHAAVLSVPILDRSLSQVRVAEVLIPRINEHDIMLTGVSKDCPSAARRWIAGGLLGEGTVVALQYVFKRREPFGAWPHLNEISLEYTALSWIRILLQLPSGSIHAEQALEISHFLLTKTLRTYQLALLCTWIISAQAGGAPLAVPLCRDHEVFPPANIFQHMATDVSLMQSLHDSHHSV